MFKFITILSALFALFTLTSLPWVSACLYTLFSVLQPQYVWFWAFEGFPAFKIFAGLAIVSWVVTALKGNIDFKVYALPVNKALITITILFNLSELFSSYSSTFAAELVLEIFNTTMLLYFVCLGCIAEKKAIFYVCMTFLCSGVYYAYDGNMAYFSGDWSRFVQGRLGGPRNGAYDDNNKFAILLVLTFPFLLFGFFYFKNVFVKVAMVIGMVLVMHGVFLTGSRGALLAVGASVFISSRSIKSKLLSYLIIAGFVGVVIDQAQGTLYRSKEVVSNSQAQEPVNPRIKSWTVGFKLIGDYPILGTGIYRFRQASLKHYPGESPHVAHNTFITFSVNSGILCGFLYIYLFYASFKMRKKIITNNEDDSIFTYSGNACFAALMGFFVGAIFLDMVVFEPLYYLIMLMSATYYLGVVKSESSNNNNENVKGNQHV